MKSVIILGKGYIGTALFEYLNTFKIPVIHVSRADVDYNDYYTLLNFLTVVDPQYVINCSGFTGKPNIDEAEIKSKECWALNVTGPVEVNRACRSKSIEYIHISTGCIYNGYDKVYTEKDFPNFGLMAKDSSFYAKSKHAYELSGGNYGMTLRIRMPYCSYQHDRSFLTKILKYDNLINTRNSKTALRDLQRFILHIVQHSIPVQPIGVLNFVNPDPLNILEIVKILKDRGLVNWKWNFVESVDTKANRSNCVLSSDKLNRLFPNFVVNTEHDAIINILPQSSYDTQNENLRSTK